MDDIGNLVYILVFIIWFLYRAFGKGKKSSKPLPPFDQSAPQPRHDEESTKPVMTFEDVLRELTGTPSGPPEQEPEVYYDAEDSYPSDDQEESSFEVLEPPTVSTSPTVATTGTGITLEGKFQEFAILKEQSSKAARDAFKMLKSKQGAKQAFIMKEIFDRKY